MSRRVPALALVILGGRCCLTASPAASFDRFEAQTPAAAPAAVKAPLSDADIEKFLLNGQVIRTRSVKKGTTGTSRVTMTTEGLTHDGQIQTIDDSKREFRTDRGVEFNFRDSWMFNVAAYKIDRLIADVAKFAMTGMVRVCGPESLDHVVTDAPLPASVRSVVDANGIEVTVA